MNNEADKERETTPEKIFSVFFDAESPSYTGNSCIFKPASPSYPMWDFDLPPVPERVKQEALQIKKGLQDGNSARRRLLRKSVPYRFPKAKRHHSEDTTPKEAAIKSVNILKEALGEIPKISHDVTPLETQVLSQSELFDDSLNDYLSECSILAEKAFTQEKTQNTDAVSQQSKAISEGKASTHSSSSLLEAFDDLDDELFLNIDINEFH